MTSLARAGHDVGGVVVVPVGAARSSDARRAGVALRQAAVTQAKLLATTVPAAAASTSTTTPASTPMIMPSAGDDDDDDDDKSDGGGAVVVAGSGAPPEPLLMPLKIEHVEDARDTPGVVRIEAAARLEALNRAIACAADDAEVEALKAKAGDEDDLAERQRIVEEKESAVLVRRLNGAALELVRNLDIALATLDYSLW